MKNLSKPIKIILGSVLGFFLICVVIVVAAVASGPVPMTASPTAKPIASSTPTPALAPAPTPTKAPAPSKAPAASPDEVFLAAIHGLNDPYLEDTSDTDAIQLAKNSCDSVAVNGVDATINRLAALAVQYGVPPRVVGEIFGAGVVAYCPQYTDEVDAWLSANNASGADS